MGAYLLGRKVEMKIKFLKGTVFASVLTVTFLLSGCSTHPLQNKTTNSVSVVPNPPYNYNHLMGFQPMLPSQDFQLKQADAYVFKWVNPPWGKVNPQVMETWGNDTAFDATYLAPNGTGKSFTVMETKINTSAPPNIKTPWRSFQKNGKTFYENTVPGYGTGVATINKGILYLISSNISNHGAFKITQLEQILQSLSVPVRTAPDSIKTQVFGISKAPTAVPFTALIPKTVPFNWDTKTAVGEDVETYRGKVKQNTGRLTLTYARGNTQLKIIEGLGMKYVNPNIAKAENGVKVVLNDGEQSVYIDGGPAVSFVDGGSSNRKVITWNTKSGVNMIVVESINLTKSDLIEVANSLSRNQ